MDPAVPAGGTQGNNIQFRIGDNSLISGGGIPDRKEDFVLVNSAGSLFTTSINVKQETDSLPALPTPLTMMQSDGSR
jgi:hypothetical protein